ncbi:protein SLOW WALKER 2-like isoform X1 [Carex rostrata]
MVKSKTAKASSTTVEDLATLQSDVISFASSLGLVAGVPSSSSGFDDTDFRKPPKPVKPPVAKSPQENAKPTSKSHDPKVPKRNKPKPLEVAPFESNSDGAHKGAELPLMKSSSLSGTWYVDADELEARILGKEGRGTKPRITGVEEMRKLVERKKELGEKLMQQYTREYQETARKKKSGDLRLLEATARSGTTTDKVTAFACLVQDNAIANVRSLDALLSMVTSKVGKRYAFTGFDALKELFLSRLLPDRKLKSLFQRPLDALPETKDGYSLLLFWHWEECLKQRYETFVIALEEALKDMLPSLKDRAMKSVFVLLKSKSEQERRLLTALVNKLGDPDNKAASGAVHHLLLLLDVHPNMKAVIIDEVDSFLFRPHISLRAKYHAVIFLNQLRHSKIGDGPKLAKRAVDVYFALFKVLMSEPSENPSQKDYKPDKKGAGKWKHKGRKEKKPHKKSEQETFDSDVEMDSRLLSALLTGVNRAFPFVSSDEADDILEVQTPILFRLVHSVNFNVGVQALMLLYQISSKNQIASDRFYRALYAKLLSPAALTSSKPELFIGLLTKAMKNDINLKRVAAFSKRLLQVALQRPPQYACGCLFLLSEVLIAKPPLWSMVLQNELDDDEIEHFEDIVEVSDDELGKPNAKPGRKNGQDGVDSKVENGKIQYPSKVDKEVHTSEVGTTLPAGYNPRHREPSYCNADRAAWWELSVLASHVHPSVATMARTLLSGAPIVYNGNPLSDLSLAAFLDKFMEKKPKTNKIAEGIWHGGSSIAPNCKIDTNPRLIGEDILKLADDEVPPEDLFFHQYYMNKGGSRNRKSKKAMADDEDGTDGGLLLDVDAAGDSEEDEIEDAEIEEEDSEVDEMLGTSVMSDQEEYDYDDLDRIGGDDDDELLGNAGDDDDVDVEDIDIESDDGNDDDDWSGGDANEVHVVVDDDGGSTKVGGKGKKRKHGGSPFASLEDYEHLMNDDGAGIAKSKKLKGKDKNRKHGGGVGASPFARLEDYEHLMNDDGAEIAKSKKLKGKDKNRKHGGGVRGSPFASLEDYEHLMKDDGAEIAISKKLSAKEKTRNKNKGTKNDRSKKRKKSN